MTPEKAKFYSDLGSAAHFLETYMKRWGRMQANAKEKYDEVRCYTTFGWESLHSITHPGYYHMTYGPVMLWLNKVTQPLIWQLNRWAVPYHKWLYGRAYRLAIKRWPQIVEPLCQGADDVSLIPGIREEKFLLVSSDSEEYNEWDEAKRVASQLAKQGEQVVAVWYKHYKADSGYYAYYYNPEDFK